MNSVLIVLRKETPEASRLGKEIQKYLEGQDKKTLLLDSDQDLAPGFEPELVVVLGGDGTYLSAVHKIQGQDIPILGINMGSLGFLTEVRKEEAFQAIDLALSQKLEKVPRSLLDYKLTHGSKTISSHFALNDIVIERGARTQMVRLQLYCESDLVYDLKADGLIFSSPTGSTAYNLAAGGPIVHHQSSVITVTPVAPHSLTSRPLVFPDHLTLKLRLASGDQSANLTVDGSEPQQLTDQYELYINKSPKTHTLLRQSGDTYFELLREKFKFGERA